MKVMNAACEYVLFMAYVCFWCLDHQQATGAIKHLLMTAKGAHGSSVQREEPDRLLLTAGQSSQPQPLSWTAAGKFMNFSMLIIKVDIQDCYLESLILLSDMSTLWHM